MSGDPGYRPHPRWMKAVAIVCLVATLALVVAGIF